LLEARLLRAQRVESIGSLASGIAHDLNNILTPIVMSVALLRDEETSASRPLVRTIDISVQRAIGIVKQLLTFARGKEGRKLPIQVGQVIREIVTLVRETFPRSIRVEDRCAPDLWPVQADATQFHQVLLNLCVNARDAMPTGGTLTLRADNTLLDEHFASMNKEASPGPHVRIQVQDTGTGIPDAVRDRIFECFFTTKDQGAGSGLGLTTVQGIVRDHKGFLTFTTAAGRGTCFEIHLPATPDGASCGKLLEVVHSAPRGRGELVLVVDDEPIICEATRRALEHHGYTVLEAHDGIQALACFSAHQNGVRVVVTDYMMPLMDGMTLCRALRALSPGIPIVVSSGGLFDQMGGDALNAFEALGIREILYKPHTSVVLLDAIHRVLRPVEAGVDESPGAWITGRRRLPPQSSA